MKLNEAMCCRRLGLSVPSNAQEVKKTYKTLARTLHPDLGGDEEAFKEVSAAYQYLLELYEKNPNRERPVYKKAEKQKSKSSTSYSKASSTKSSSTKSSSTKSKSSSSTDSSKSSSKSSSTSTQSNTTSNTTSSNPSSSHDPTQDDPSYSEQDYQEAWNAWRSQYSTYNSSSSTSSSTSSSSSSTSSRTSRRRSSSDQNPKASPYSQDRYTSSSTSSASSASSNPSSTSSSPSDSAVQPVEVDVEVVPNLSDQFGRWGTKVKHKAVRWFRSQSRQFHEKGKDEKLRLDIDEYTLFFGSQKRIAIKRLIPCPKCQDKESNSTALDQAQSCLICEGEARILDREEISLYIPPGAQAGEKLKVTGKGTAGLCGHPHGNLYLVIHPPPLPSGFSRKGADLYLDLSVPSEILKRGGSVSFSTPRGPLSVKVPAHSSPGRKLSVRNHGLPYWNQEEQKGNLVIILRSSST